MPPESIANTEYETYDVPRELLPMPIIEEVEMVNLNEVQNYPIWDLRFRRSRSKVP